MVATATIRIMKIAWVTYTGSRLGAEQIFEVLDLKERPGKLPKPKPPMVPLSQGYIITIRAYC